MRFLLTNDDGIDAPGLQALRKAASQFGEVKVVAPATGVSGCSHTVSEGSFRVFRLDDDRTAVEGTPTDCVRVGIHLYGEDIDWVLSGINNGGNLGVDVYQSGTVAAVREGSLRGIPGIALSHYRDRILNQSDWSRAQQWSETVIRKILEEQSSELQYWNVNFPSLAETNGHVPDIVNCPLDAAPIPVAYLEQDGEYRYHGRYALRPRTQGADVDVCFGGKIALSRIKLMEDCGKRQS
jgi:5'-nucleotidase